MLTLIGGTGFLGKHVCQALDAVGWPARTLSRNPDAAFLRQSAPQVEPIVIDTDAARDALGEASTVVYMAHASRPATFADAPEVEVRENVERAARLLKHLDPACLKRFIYLSSGGQIYGRQPARPIPETTPPAPVTAYGMGKQLVEDLLAFRFRESECGLTVLRLANPVGRHQAGGGHGLVAAAAGAALSGAELKIFGEGRNDRDYFDADDFASFLVNALAKNTLKDGVFNIGTGVGRTELDIINAVEKALGAHIRLSHAPARSFDLPYSVLSIEKAAQALGWRAETNLQTTIGKLVEHTSGRAAASGA